MPHAAMIRDWQAQIAAHFPDLPTPTARALASLGMARARSGLPDTLLVSPRAAWYGMWAWIEAGFGD